MTPPPDNGTLRVLAVDDERPALEDLGRLIETSDAVATVVLAEGGAQALHCIAEQPFDVIFLDVRMPDIDGLELASLLGRFAAPPALVFVSAYEDGAVGAIEQDLHPIDYLMKPVSRTRVEQALQRVLAGEERSARGSAASRMGSGAPDDSTLPPGTTDEIIPVEHQRGGATRLLERSSINYVQAEGDYVRIHADSGRYLVRAALTDVERRWGPYGFVRVHRSYVANLHRAIEIRPELSGAVTIVFGDGSRIPVARRQVADLRRRLRM
jgi:DNA-binding LytR/AlgR family response regulator